MKALMALALGLSIQSTFAVSEVVNRPGLRVIQMMIQNEKAFETWKSKHDTAGAEITKATAVKTASSMEQNEDGETVINETWKYEILSSDSLNSDVNGYDYRWKVTEEHTFDGYTGFSTFKNSIKRR